MITAENENKGVCDNEEISEDKKKQCVEELRKLITDNKKLQGLKTDDDYLLRFLYSCNFDVQATYEKMTNFYDLLLEFPDWFATAPPVESKPVLEQDVRVLLPIEDKEGRPVYLVKVGNMNPDIMDVLDLVHLDEFWMEFGFNSTRLSEKGLSVIIDVEHIPWKLMKWMTPQILKNCVRKLNSFPIKEFRFHVVNSTFVLNLFVKILWPFLDEKIKKVVKFHFNNWSSLHEHISPEVLPPEYRGTNEKIHYNELYEKFLDMNDCIAENVRKHHCLSLVKA